MSTSPPSAGRDRVRPTRRAVLRRAVALAVAVFGVVAVSTATPATTSAAAAAASTAVAVPPQQRGAECHGTTRVQCTWSFAGHLVVPAGVRSIRVEARGGEGGVGRFGGDGGRGSVLSATFAVSRGQQVDVVVGQQGGRGFTKQSIVPGGTGAGRGGRGGGGTPLAPVTYAGGGGGGASRVSIGTEVLIVAGGGGGGGGRGSLTSSGGDGEPSGPSTDSPNGADGVASARLDSGSGGGGGGVRGGQAGRPGDDGRLYSSGSYGGHAGTSTSPPGSYFREGENSGDGRVVITFDEPVDQHLRPELGVAVSAPDQVVIGRPFTVTVTVTNRGGVAFDDVSTRVSFSPSLQVVGPGDEEPWSVGPLLEHATATRAFTVVSPRVGRGTVTAVGRALGPTGADADHASASVLATTPRAAGL